MGYGVLRQVRIRESPDTCTLNERTKKLLPVDRAHCREFANMIYEDRKSYGVGWSNAPQLSNRNSTSQHEDNEDNADPDDETLEEGIATRLPGEDIVLLNPSKSKKTEWQYRKPSELDGLPFWGKIGECAARFYVQFCCSSVLQFCAAILYCFSVLLVCGSSVLHPSPLALSNCHNFWRRFSLRFSFIQTCIRAAVTSCR